MSDIARRVKPSRAARRGAGCQTPTVTIVILEMHLSAGYLSVLTRLTGAGSPWLWVALIAGASSLPRQGRMMVGCWWVLFRWGTGRVVVGMLP